LQRGGAGGSSLIYANLSAETGVIFQSWAKEKVFMPPNEEGVDLLTKMWPLKLQGAPKVVTVGIKNHRVTSSG
jgi:hypothetical protein